MANLFDRAGYAVYFDHKRRTDPEFRKALKRESRREARVAKEQAEAEGEQQRGAIKAAVNRAKEEGFPTDVEERETYFMNEVGQGEVLSQDSEFLSLECSLISLLRNLARFKASRSSTLLLQSPQSVSATKRSHRNLRQNRAEARN